MSYILDALKKSERERQLREPATLSTIDQHIPHQRHAGYRVAGLVVAIVLLTLVVLAGGWFLGSGGFQLADSNTQQALEPVKKAPESTAPSQVPPKAKVAESGVQATQGVPPAEAPIQELWQLPPAIRSAVGSLAFSLHVYSHEASQRSIIINNRMMREGEALNADLRLLEITAEGVILEYQGTRFSVSVLENW